jgi:hypothetical protein
MAAFFFYPVTITSTVPAAKVTDRVGRHYEPTPGIDDDVVKQMR